MASKRSCNADVRRAATDLWFLVGGQGRPGGYLGASLKGRRWARGVACYAHRPLDRGHLLHRESVYREPDHLLQCNITSL
jgi:hypothetical protein